MSDQGDMPRTQSRRVVHRGDQDTVQRHMLQVGILGISDQIDLWRVTLLVLQVEWFLCEAGTAARHGIYAGQRRR